MLNRALSTDASERHSDVIEFATELISAVREWRPADIVEPLVSLSRSSVAIAAAPRRSRRRVFMVGGALALPAIAAAGYLLSVSLNRRATHRDTATPRSAPQTPVQAGTTVQSKPDTAKLAKLDSPPPAPTTKTASVSPRETAARRSEPHMTPAPRAAVQTVKTEPPAPAPDTEPPTLPAFQVPPVRLSPKVGWIAIGTPLDFGAGLYLNNELIGVPRGLRIYQVTPGIVSIRLHLENCADWDTTIAVGAGDTARVGSRRPGCPP